MKSVGQEKWNIFFILKFIIGTCLLFHDIHAGMDYQWFDPYETESLFTDYKGYVTELHANEEDGVQFNKGKVSQKRKCKKVSNLEISYFFLYILNS